MKFYSDRYKTVLLKNNTAVEHMNIRTFSVFFLLFILSMSSVSAQAHRRKPENYFGLQVKPLIPLRLVGDKPFDIKNGNFNSTISPIFGYSYGGVIRVGLTELLAIESGINFTKRNYKAEYSLPDSSLTAEDDLGFISFNIPLNLLVYVKLGNQFYMNVSGGASVNYNPSNIRSKINPSGAHLFIFEGRRLHFFDFNANIEVGFEYRTVYSGTFYLGISGRIPFTPTLDIATEYRNDTYKSVAYGQIEGATFALAIKYFFHNNNHKEGTQFQRGPIEQ